MNVSRISCSATIKWMERSLTVLRRRPSLLVGEITYISLNRTEEEAAILPNRLLLAISFVADNEGKVYVADIIHNDLSREIPSSKAKEWLP